MSLRSFDRTVLESRGCVGRSIEPECPAECLDDLLRSTRRFLYLNYNRIRPNNVVRLFPPSFGVAF
jgi:hypothetical protein